MRVTYGHFDDARREFVITQPDTPSPWINYLGSESFFTLVSGTGGGYSFYKDARLLRLTRYRYNSIPADQGGQYFYLRDGEDFWTPGWMPVKAPLDDYQCRHGLGYTVITGRRGDLRACQEMLVPLGYSALVTRLRLENRGHRLKTVDLYSFVEFCLWDAMDDATNFQRNFSTGEVEVEGSCIYHVTEYRERRSHYALFGVNAPIQGFDTDRQSFLGPYGGLEAPRAVVENASGDSLASGWAPVGSHHLRLTLAPGEEKSLIFVLGYCENDPKHKFTAPGVVNKAPAQALMRAFAADAQFEGALAALKAYWESLLSRFQAQTGDEKLDRMVNVWLLSTCRDRPATTNRASVGAWAFATPPRICWASST